MFGVCMVLLFYNNVGMIWCNFFFYKQSIFDLLPENCLVDGLLAFIVSILKHSKRCHSLLQGHLEYVMRTFELTSPYGAFLLGFLCRKRVLACSRCGLFNFHLCLIPANCLEIV